MRTVGDDLKEPQSVHDSRSTEPSFSFYYEQGLHLYERLLQQDIPKQTRLGRMSTEERVYEKGELQSRTIENLSNSLLYVGNRTEQILKIKALLILVSLQDNKELQEKYFYDAIEIARHYLGDSLEGIPYENDIITIYLSHIDTTIEKQFPKKFLPSLIPLIRTSILATSNVRMQKIREEATDTKNYLRDSPTASTILCKLKEVFGPIRLLIVWKESGEVLMNDGFDESEIQEKKSVSAFTQCITGVIFDRKREYLVTIDRGSTESENQFKKYDLEQIIHPVLSLYIKAKEDTFFTGTSENSSTVEMTEANMKMDSQTNDYQGFVSEVIRNYSSSLGFNKYREEYTQDFLQALHICRNITLGGREHREYFIKDIDETLRGEARGEVLHMVQSMLLSRNEAINGSGYPFGVSKKSIPLEGKLYSIIRAYEALRALHGNEKKVLLSMNDWAFDSDIYQIFLQSVDDEGRFPKILTVPALVHPMSELRKKRYGAHVDSWFRIITLIKDIETYYTDGRLAEGDEETQRNAFQEASRLVSELNNEVGMQSIIAYSRHGESEMDTLGKSANKNDPLTENGQNTSRAIGEAYQGLKIDIYSSEILRAHASAELIQAGVVSQIDSTLSGDIDNIHIEASLTNPEKSRERFWREGSGSRLFTIILDENTRGLVKFLEGLASPLMERASLLVTHGHVANIIDTLLENFCRQNGFSSGRTSMGNGMVCVYLIQRGNSTKKLLFPITEWKCILREINTITMDIFGEIFYDRAGQQIDPFKLHRRFVDFIDNKQEDSVEKVSLLMEQLEKNLLLQDFPSILRAEQVID